MSTVGFITKPQEQTHFPCGPFSFCVICFRMAFCALFWNNRICLFFVIKNKTALFASHIFSFSLFALHRLDTDPKNMIFAFFWKSSLLCLYIHRHKSIPGVEGKKKNKKHRKDLFAQPHSVSLHLSLSIFYLNHSGALLFLSLFFSRHVSWGEASSCDECKCCPSPPLFS